MRIRKAATVQAASRANLTSKYWRQQYRKRRKI